MSIGSRWSDPVGRAGHPGRPRRGEIPDGAAGPDGSALRLYLVPAPGGDVEAVADVLATCHGFRRFALPQAGADGPCATASSSRAAALARAVAMEGRVVITGLGCAAEAGMVEEHGFCGVAVATTRVPVVCTVTAAPGPWQREALQRPGRRPAPPACGHRVPRVAYVLDTGRESVLAREHIATLVAVLETLRYLHEPSEAPRRGPGRRAAPTPGPWGGRPPHPR